MSRLDASFHTARSAATRLLALALLAPSAVLATVVMAQTFEELCAGATAVVRVQVGPSQSAWDEKNGRIWTWTEVRVTEPLKGGVDGTVLVKQPGGVVGPIGQAVAGTAQFKEGQDSVLFLSPAPDEKGVYLVRSMAAGKVDFEERLGAVVALRNLDGIAFAARGRDGTRPVDGAGTEVVGTKDAFLERVRRAVRGGSR